MMKYQYLAVVFVIIMLPISLVFSAYVGAQLDTLDLQISYDTKLDNATYDAIKAFQLNTINSSTSDIVNSKIRDIEAAANSFFTSIATNFNMAGYNSDNLKEYVPALVFTLYDGFYIYSPFENTLDEETKNHLPPDATYTGADGEEVTGLKPYIYYSCRYVKGQMDVTITYSLDNYITVQGTDRNGKGINDAGYLLDDVTYNDVTGEVRYRGVNITSEPQLREYIGNTEYAYVKINGVKYYRENDNTNTWFTITNGRKSTVTNPFRNEPNDMGYRYYVEAYEFKQRLQSYGITNLKSSDAVGVEDITNADGEVIYSFVDSDYNIFDFDGIEEPDSNFNNHRMAVIRYVIESNLTVALANYNNFGTGTYEFRMPKLAEEDWARILDNVCLISFLQGVSIGGKIYNGYSVINNNKNEEVVTEDSIYIVENVNDDNSEYHRVTHKGLENMVNETSSRGVFNIDLERKSVGSTNSETTLYFYPHWNLGCYTCYVAQTNTENSFNNIYEYLDGLSNKTLTKLYYTALGRERYSMYKTFRNPSEFVAQYREVPKIDKKILLFGIPSHRGNDLTQLRDELLEKYTTVDMITSAQGEVSQDIVDQVMGIADNYDLVICDAYVWPAAQIANQSTLNYNLITISNDATTVDNQLIESSITTSNVYANQIMTQPGLLQNITINPSDDGDGGTLVKAKFKDDVTVLATTTYNDGDADVYDAIGYKNIGGYKQIHSQLVLKNNYVEIIKLLADFALQ